MNKQKFGIILPITLFAYFLILMDNSIIFTSSVEIGKALSMNASTLAWISNAYTLTFGGFLLLSGRLSDLLGRKRIFQIGLALFGIASLLIGISFNAEMLIGLRALQGIGSSIIAPTTLALMMDAYDGEMRTKAITYYGATAGIGSGIGLVIGGALTSFVSWRAGFLINVPLSILLVILTHIYIPDRGAQKDARIDYLGGVLSVVSMALIIYGLSSRFVILLITGLILLAILLYREAHVETPLLPLTLFIDRTRAGAYVVRLLYMMAILPYWYLMPQQLQSQYGYSALHAGIAFLPLSGVTFITSLFASRLIKHFSNDIVLVIGEIALLIGLIGSALIPLNMGYLYAVALPMIPLGIGSSLALATITNDGIAGAPKDLSGAASGLTNTMHQLGGPIGLSIIMSMSLSFQGQLSMMVIYTIISFLIVLVVLLPVSLKKRIQA